MRSPQVAAHHSDEKGRYSELQVLQSAAGFYVGTVYHAPEGYTEPGSRDSGYFKTREDAQKFLDYTNGSGDTDFLRKDP